MKDFSPYHIVHQQLGELDKNLRFFKNTYCVFWIGRFPLGHRFLNVESVREVSVSLQEISRLVRPALLSYADQKAPACRKELEALLHRNDLPGISNVFLNAVQQAEDEGQQRGAETLTVVICTRNRPEALQACLDRLFCSTDLDFETIVVDNCPDNNASLQVVSRYPQARYLREGRKGLDIARNTGAFHARSRLVAYTDDDVLVDDGWTARLKRSFKDPLCLAVTGLVIPAALESPWQLLFEQEWGFNKGYTARRFDHGYFREHQALGPPVWDIGAGANMAFRKEVFDLVGYFDERLDVGAAGCSGDSEFWYRILSCGWTCQYLPELFVYHQHRRSEAELNRQLFQYMKGNVASIMVQHQFDGIPGHLRRLTSVFPRYYLQKLRHTIRYPGALKRVMIEIWGCINGYFFFLRHKNKPVCRLVRPLPPELKQPVEVPPGVLVSVIIPCFNHGRYLPQAIESVYAQSYAAVEVVVINDGSTDNTERLCARYPDLRYLRTERVGLSAARNIGVSLSTGDFLVFLDADDFLYPDALKINLDYFRRFPLSVYVSGAHDKVAERGPLPVTASRVVAEKNYWELLYGNYIAMEGTVLYRRALFFHFSFDTRLKVAEDYDLNLRISRVLPAYSHTEKIAVYRIHPQAMSADPHNMLKGVLRALRKQRPFLKDFAEWKAYYTGRINWKKYYRKLKVK